MTLKEISEKYGISKERARQFIRGYGAYKPLLTKDDYTENEIEINQLGEQKIAEYLTRKRNRRC